MTVAGPGFPRPRWSFGDEAGEAVTTLTEGIRSLVGEELKSCLDAKKLKLLRQLQTMPLGILAGLLYRRGVTGARESLDFLFPDLSQLHPWQGLPDIDKAVERLCLARQRQEKVLIHGDYDADGITATTLLTRALRHFGIESCYYLPHRQEDGYGLSEAGIEEGAAKGCTLLLTVDCGISDLAEVEHAKSLGMDVIITDHHLPPPELPDALAVINPKLAGSAYPFSELAGAGVALKLAQALMPDSKQLTIWLQLAAMGTVADLVPLVGENRAIVALGLAEMNDQPLAGIVALAAVAGYQVGNLSAEDIAFGFAPRLNAAGRMDSAGPGVELLLAEDEFLVQDQAVLLDKENKLRRRIEEENFNEAVLQAEEQVSRGRRLLVVHGRDWHGGVIGIVAAKLLQRYYRPAVVLCGEGELTGSARSVPGFDIYEALQAAATHMESFGGHPGAAGLTLAEKKLIPFADTVEEYAVGKDIDSLLVPTIALETSLTPNDMKIELADTVALLAPFGFGNPEPIFAVKGYTAGNLSLVGTNKNHFRVGLHGQNSKERLWAIGFGKSHLVHNVDLGQPLVLAGSVNLNHWQGRTRLQLQFSDVVGTTRPKLGGREIVDRRGQREPWLGELVGQKGTVFLANTQWQACQLLGRGMDERIIILPPDKCGKEVYNLVAREVAFLDPGWSYEQLVECISALPSSCRLHFFGGAAPAEVLHPNLQLLRFFYRAWQEKGPGADLLNLLPKDLAEPLLLERTLDIFAEAGLAVNDAAGWQLVYRRDKVDLTCTEAWRRNEKTLARYRQWLQEFASGELDTLLA